MYDVMVCAMHNCVRGSRDVRTNRERKSVILQNIGQAQINFEWTKIAGVNLTYVLGALIDEKAQVQTDQW